MLHCIDCCSRGSSKASLRADFEPRLVEGKKLEDLRDRGEVVTWSNGKRGGSSKFRGAATCMRPFQCVRGWEMVHNSVWRAYLNHHLYIFKKIIIHKHKINLFFNFFSIFGFNFVF